MYLPGPEGPVFSLYAAAVAVAVAIPVAVTAAGADAAAAAIASAVAAAAAMAAAAAAAGTENRAAAAGIAAGVGDEIRERQGVEQGTVAGIAGHEISPKEENIVEVFASTTFYAPVLPGVTASCQNPPAAPYPAAEHSPAAAADPGGP